MHESDSITASHKHRKYSSVMVRVFGSQASDLGSKPGQVSEFFGKFFVFCRIRLIQQEL